MQYTTKEILASFMQNPKRSQIEILADLNEVTEAYIEKVLIDAGIKIPQKKKTARKKTDLEIAIEREQTADVVVEALTEAMIREQETIDYHKEKLQTLLETLDRYRKGLSINGK